MKNFKFSAYGVEEMTNQELKAVDGGKFQFNILIFQIDNNRPKGERFKWFWELM